MAAPLDIERPAGENAPAMAPSRPLLLLLILLMALGESSSQLLLPALPDAAASLRATPSAVQATFGAFAAALGVGQLVAGPVADRFGRRPMLLGGLTLFVAGALACLWAGGLDQLVLGRVLQGLGASAGVVGARAIARDVWKTEAPKAIALTVFGLMVMLMASPVLGGLLSGSLGWRAVCALAAGLGALGWLAVAVGYAETRPASAPSEAPGGAGTMRLGALAARYAELFAHRGFLANMLALGGIYGVLFAYVSGGGFVLSRQFGLAPAGVGAASSLVLAGLVIGTLAASRLVQTLGLARLVGLGTAGAFVGVLAAAAGAPSGSLVLFLAPQLLITLGAGLVLPSAVAGAVMPFGARAGLAAGVLGFAQMMTGAAFAGLLGLMADGSAGPLLLVQAIAATLALAGFRVMMPASVARPQEAPGTR